MRSETVELVLSFLCFAAIPSLVCLAPELFRKLRGRPAKSTFKDLILACLISIGIATAITLAICFVMNAIGFSSSQFFRPTKKDYGFAKELKLSPEDIFFESQDGVRLHGWYLPAKSKPVGTVICFHGSDLNITFTVKNVAWLLNHNLNVFVFDYRGYGRSEGSPESKGLIGDSVAAIDYVLSRSAESGDSVVLYGQSMGGQLAINAAAAKNGERIAAVIAEATYASPSLHISVKMGQLGPLWLLKWGMWLTTSDQWSAERSVSELGTPLLLIHGSEDTGVNPYHSERLFDLATQPKDIWRVDGHGHLKIFNSDSEKNKLVDFIKSHL